MKQIQPRAVSQVTVYQIILNRLFTIYLLPHMRYQCKHLSGQQRSDENKFLQTPHWKFDTLFICIDIK